MRAVQAILYSVAIAIVILSKESDAFLPSSASIQKPATSTATAPSSILQMNKDPSRSGTKRDRLDRLADLQEDTVETDKSVFIKGAGAFALLIVISIVAAASSGLLM